jgi:hypothetical protein
MKATRRDYLDIVKVIRRLEKGTTRRLMWAHAFATILKRSNPQFRVQVFVDACGADDSDTSNVVSFAEKVLDKDI